MNESVRVTGQKTGMNRADLLDPEQVRTQLEAVSKKDGTARKGSEEKYEALKQHLRVINELKYKGLETIDEWNQAYEKTNENLVTAQNKQEEIRGQKRKLTQDILDQAQKEGKVTEETKETLSALVEQEDARNKNAEAANKVAAAESKNKIKDNIKQTKEYSKASDGLRKSFLGKVTAATLYYIALRNLRRLMNSVMKTVKELDKSITEVAMVTNMSRQQAWQLVGSYQALAKEVGSTTQEIAKLSVYFFRQGRSAKDALELTKVAATAAKVASIDAAESANYLTSAINGFGLAADQATAVSDKFAALGASSASSYEEMAIALSKVAPVARTAGVGIDFMMGIIAKGIETTREAPENIGTAFKTVFARMTQIRDFGATLDDSTGVNQVEKALKQANVTLRDSSGNFRDMDLVLTDLGYA
jgi:hypothetical protein